MHVLSLLTIAALLITQGHSSSSAPHARIINFIHPTLLNGSDGLTPNPAAPLRYGAPSLLFDTAGNALDSHESSLSYFHNRYYLYTHAWACGSTTSLSGVKAGGTANDSSGKCGLATYSSPDLVTWEFEDLYQPQGLPSEAAQPVALWSPGLGKHVLWFKAGGNFNATGYLFYAVSEDGPQGPWGKWEVAGGEHLSHNFAIAEGEDGEAWIASCVFGGYDEQVEGKPLWDIWVQRLNAERTGTVGTEETMAQAMAPKVDFEGIGLVERGGWWYLTGGPTAANAPTSIAYIRAPSPLGPWTNLAGNVGENLTAGTVISETGCTGQNKGIAKLPSVEGDVILSQVMGYRTSPDNLVQDGIVVHGDNSQAIATTYFFPLAFDDERHEIRPLQCQPTVSIPLASNIGLAPVPSPVPHQPDCRIRAGSTIVQNFTPPRRFYDCFSVPVWQQTDDGGIAGNNATHVGSDLTITLVTADGRNQSKRFAPNEISWVPQVVRVPVEHTQEVRAVELSSTAANGCYGTVVRPRSERGDYQAVLANGTILLDPRAELILS